MRFGGKLFLIFIYFERERERECVCEQVRSRKTGERESPRRLLTVSTKPNVGLELRNCEIMT